MALAAPNVEIHAIDPNEKMPQLFIQVGTFDVEQNAVSLPIKLKSLTKDKGHIVAVKRSKTKAGKSFMYILAPLNDETVVTELTKTIRCKNNLPKPKRSYVNQLPSTQRQSSNTARPIKPKTSKIRKN